MSATKKLLDKYRETCSTRSDNAIAVSLGLSRTAVSRWVNGSGHPDADSIARMAAAIGDKPGPWLAQIEADRARNPAARQVWLRLAASLGVTVALAGVALPSHTEAHAVQAGAGLSIV